MLLLAVPNPWIGCVKNPFRTFFSGLASSISEVFPVNQKPARVRLPEAGTLLNNPPLIRVQQILAVFTILPLMASIVAVPVRASETAVVSFNHDIRPILSHNCIACHGPDEHDRQAGLRLDVRESALAELESGLRAIVPGSPEKSELVTRIRENDPDVIMPPPESNHLLSAEQKKLLVRWIAEGAPYQPHWAYVIPEQHPTPTVRNTNWTSNWIDTFILASLEREGLQPAADAEPITLLRRVTFDLTGLPPTPAEVDTYLAADPTDRYERLVDSLLSSPRHAERLAAWWLDLVRYADTVGYHGDQDHNASPYRDWVIAAFLDNLPFDRFTLLQLSGDLIEPQAGEHPDDRVLAAAYNRLLQTSHEGGLQVKEYRAIYQADRIRNFSGVWLGATVGCAQCHDHKYDPFTSQDFYSLGAFFADIDDEKHMGRAGFGGAPNRTPTTREPEQAVVSPFDRDRVAAIDAEISLLRQTLPSSSPSVVIPALGAKTTASTNAKIATDDKQPKRVESSEVMAARKRLEALKKKRKRLVRMLMVTRQLNQPRVVRLLPRGNWMDETGPVVDPAVPHFLGQLRVSGRANRADLARWVVTSASEGGIGELTARVTVNRLWSLFFGAGISRSVNDFGGQGEPPDHPELLDRLALELFESGWDLRQLIRMIVVSRAYRMTSVVSADLLARDPDNRLLARQGRWRYPAEGVRDAVLAASGLLVEKLGGSSVHPYQPAGYYRHLNFPQRTYKRDNDQRQWRRGLYVHWQRMFLHPQLLAFDAPTREECTAIRMRSNTPKAALVLLNDPTFVEAARKLAEQTLKQADNDASRLTILWRKAVSRFPDEREKSLLEALLARRRQEYAKEKSAAAELLSVGISSPALSQDPVELAAWTATARAVLNLRETIGRY